MIQVTSKFAIFVDHTILKNASGHADFLKRWQ